MTVLSEAIADDFTRVAEPTAIDLSEHRTASL